MSMQYRSYSRSLRSSIFSALDLALPHVGAVDKLFLLAKFFRAHNRWPRNPANAQATFNDFIFSRLVRGDWSNLERVCIDKQYVKLLIEGVCPELRMASTVEILRLSNTTFLNTVESSLLSYVGEKIVAKPTHGSGSILYLKNRPSREVIHGFVRLAAHSYYRRSRESLYAGLERKIVLEEDLSEGDVAPVDYKFFCARGVVFFCQVDVDRFVDHKRALVTPAFERIDVRYMYDEPTQGLKRPEKFDDMVRIAEKLSSLFAFVRVDLYCINDEIYFGELTFAPEGGAGSLSCEGFGVRVMAGIRQANSTSVPDLLAPGFLERLSRFSQKNAGNEIPGTIEGSPQ